MYRQLVCDTVVFQLTIFIWSNGVCDLVVLNVGVFFLTDDTAPWFYNLIYQQ